LATKCTTSKQRGYFYLQHRFCELDMEGAYPPTLRHPDTRRQWHEAKTRLYLVAKSRLRVATLPINLYAFMSSCLDRGNFKSTREEVCTFCGIKLNPYFILSEVLRRRYFESYICKVKLKVKQSLYRSITSPEGSRKLRLSDF
jgi:hypothetical protein